MLKHPTVGNCLWENWKKTSGTNMGGSADLGGELAKRRRRHARRLPANVRLPTYKAAVSSCTAGGAPSVGGGGGGWFWASGHGRDILSVTAGARGTRAIADCLGENWESLGQCQTADVLQRRFGDLPGGKLAKPRPVSDCRRTTCPPRLPGERQSLGQCPTADEQRMFGDCLGGNWQSLGQCPTADVYTSYVRGLPGGKLAKPRPVSDCRRTS